MEIYFTKFRPGRFIEQYVKPFPTGCFVIITHKVRLTLKDAGGGQNDPLVTDKACMPSIFIKTPQIFFDESCVISAFTKNFFEKLRMIEIGPRGR